MSDLIPCVHGPNDGEMRREAPMFYSKLVIGMSGDEDFPIFIYNHRLPVDPSANWAFDLREKAEGHIKEYKRHLAEEALKQRRLK